MHEPKRARRRRESRRMKRHAVEVYSRYSIRHDDPARQTKIADHLTTCSGPCCGNPRRWFGEPTMQERRHDIAYRRERVAEPLPLTTGAPHV